MKFLKLVLENINLLLENSKFKKGLQMVLLNLADNIYKNSIYMIFTRLVSVSCGFFFWIIAARYYSIEDVGLGTSMLTSMHIILMLSHYFDFSIIRFFLKSKYFDYMPDHYCYNVFILG